MFCFDLRFNVHVEPVLTTGVDMLFYTKEIKYLAEKMAAIFANSGLKLRVRNRKYFSYFSPKTYVVGT